MKIFQKFWQDNSGATAIEYAIIAGLISVAVVVGATSVGTSVSTNLQEAADGM